MSRIRIGFGGAAWAAGIASLALLLFLLVYPSVFQAVEAANPRFYAQHARETMQQGRLDEAEQFARNAVRRYPLDPHAYALLGTVLVRMGRTNEARVCLRHGAALKATPAPEYRATRRPYYNARIRLELGSLAWQDGDAAEAVRQFALAMPYADPSDEAFRIHGDTLCQAYAAAGDWYRALQFRPTSSPHGAQLPLDSLPLLAEAAAARGEWVTVQDVTPGTPSQTAILDSARHYWNGRAHLENARLAEAMQELATAADRGYGDAAYFAGVAFAEAGQPDRATQYFARIPEDSAYYLFAVAKLNSSRPEALREAVAHTPFVRLVQAPAVQLDEGFHPVLARVPEASRIPGSYLLPVLVVWSSTGTQAVVPPEGTVWKVGGNRMLLALNGRILQLEWLHAATFLAGTGASDPDSPLSRVGIAQDGATPATDLLGVPASLQTGRFYVLLGRMRTENAAGNFGWSFLQANEEVDIGYNAFNGSVSPNWTWVGAWAPALPQWTHCQPQLGARGFGVVYFDSIAFDELTPPKLPG